MIDDIDVAVTLELNTQVPDFEQRRLLEGGLKAVGAPFFDGLQVIQASLKGSGLLGVRQARVQQEAVGLAVCVIVVLGDGRLRGSRNHRVRDALGQEV